MEALKIVNETLTHKTIAEILLKKHSGPKGYPLLLRLKLLLYGHLKGYLSTRKLRKHLKKHPEVLQSLGFQTLPDRRTIDRWKKKLKDTMPQVVRLTGDRYLQTKLSEWTLIDSTPMEDEKDSEAKVGYTSKGKFKGFKLHMSCDEYEVPLRGTVTTGNVHDSMQGEALLAPTPLTGGDSAYNAERIKQAAKAQGSKPIFAHNPRRQGKAKKKKSPKILRKVRVMIEQCNSLVKNEVMLRAWKIAKGLAAKTTFALMAVLAVQALALYTLKRYGYPRVGIQWVRV